MDGKGLIGKQEIELIAQTRNLLDELLETLDIINDKETMIKLKEAKDDVKKGRLHGFDEL
ncbi:MAG: hypothetical protein ISS93_01150 [Candidatus Aenigmarchaeota archaeon]|nr:hypothetical protein [Candidatus Aenigmarchaeota archaeon]